MKISDEQAAFLWSRVGGPISLDVEGGWVKDLLEDRQKLLKVAVDLLSLAGALYSEDPVIGDRYSARERIEQAKAQLDDGQEEA